MKIVFMGTPDFAVPSLEALVEAGHEVALVVTKPDVQKNRGKQIGISEVKAKALELGLAIEQPEKVKNNPEFLEKLKEIGPDYIVAVAYGKVLPKEVLEVPKKKCLNVHGSLLPRWRGAAPIQWSILAGDELGGVTIMEMGEGLDTGDMLSKASTPIDKKNCEELFDELCKMGGKLLVETIDGLEKGEIVPEKQDDELATYAPMVFKQDGELDFALDAAELERKVRGLYPWPGTYTFLDGDMFKIWKADLVEGDNSGYEPGMVISADKDGILIACGKDRLLATMVQAPGKKKMLAADYLRGKTIEKLTKMG